MDRPLTLVEHLNELRKRIIISLAALVTAVILSSPFSSLIFKVLKFPAQDAIKRLVFFSPQEAFLMYVNISLISGLIISLPVILYQAWLFILPAVEHRLRKYAVCFVGFCFVSFIAGCLFAYFILIPTALKFLLGFAGSELEPLISIDKYISFVNALMFGCGLVFEIPMLSLILTKIGVVNPRLLRSKYKYALVVILIIAAVITPTTDVFNMLILAIPMLLLYEIGIGVSFLSCRKKASYAYR